MRYVARIYAIKIVIELGCKIVGWPARVPFRNLSKIGGGMASLRELHRLWHLTEPAEGEERLRFEPSTAEDKANVARDPVSVHPNPGMLSAADAGEPDTLLGPSRVPHLHESSGGRRSYNR